MMGSEFKDSDDEDIMTKCVRNDSEDFCDKDRFARENHSEIERRRRNKMTAYIAELSDMVPACNSLARKPDKLTILRMAVAHMKSLRGSSNPNNDSAYKPSFLTDQELKHLLLEAADGFLFVVHCDSGTIIYASDTLISVLGHKQEEWSGSSIFDYLHPDDVNKVREQLYSSWDYSNASNNNTNNINIPNAPTNHNNMVNINGINTTNPATSPNTNVTNNSNNNRVLDLKTGTIKKEGHHQGSTSARFCMGTRRGFICRIKCGNDEPSAQNTMRNHPRSARAMLGPSKDGEQYAVLHCTGYIKHWPPSGSSTLDKSSIGSTTPFSLPQTNGGSGLVPQGGASGPKLSTDRAFNKNGPTSGSSNNFCLVAIGRLQVASAPNISDILPPPEGHSICEFVSRHDTSTPDLYNFTFVDQRIKDVLGYQTQEILGNSCFEFYHPDDISHMKDTFDQVIKMKGQMISVVYRFKHKSGEWLYLRSNLYAFLNPYSEALEFIISNNSLASSSKRPLAPSRDVVERSATQMTHRALPHNPTASQCVNVGATEQISALDHSSPSQSVAPGQNMYHLQLNTLFDEPQAGVTPAAPPSLPIENGVGLRYDPGSVAPVHPTATFYPSQHHSHHHPHLQAFPKTAPTMINPEASGYETSAQHHIAGLGFGSVGNGGLSCYRGDIMAADVDHQFLDQDRQQSDQRSDTMSDALRSQINQFFRSDIEHHSSANIRPSGSPPMRVMPPDDPNPTRIEQHNSILPINNTFPSNPDQQQWINGGFPYDTNNDIMTKAPPSYLPYNYGNPPNTDHGSNYSGAVGVNQDQNYANPQHIFGLHNERCETRHEVYRNDAPGNILLAPLSYQPEHPSYFYAQNTDNYPSIHGNMNWGDPVYGSQMQNGGNDTAVHLNQAPFAQAGGVPHWNILSGASASNGPDNNHDHPGNAPLTNNNHESHHQSTFDDLTSILFTSYNSDHTTHHQQRNSET